MNKKIEKSIFATIAYYDHFNYPLTAAEIYYYLVKRNPNDQIPATNETLNAKQELKPRFFDIVKVLDSSDNLKRTIGRKNGFYFLRDREEIIASRIQKKKLADEKLKRSKWILSFISALPFVQFVAISGSMGIGNPDKKSDIDLMVISKHGRIWMARAFLTFFAIMLGAYRHSDKTANRLCLNHYIAGGSLAIDFGNLYKAQEYLNLFPVAGDMDIYRNFISANAGWLNKYIYLDAEKAGNMNLYFIRPGKFSSALKWAAEALLSGIAGDWLEKQFKKIQVYYIEKNPLTNHPHSRIRYTDDNLVFHPILVEPKIIAECKEKVRQFDITSA